MGRTLYIFAAALAALAVLAGILSLTHFSPPPYSSGDVRLWRTTGLALFCLSMIVALAGIFSSLFEQAERRHEAERLTRRRRRKES